MEMFLLGFNVVLLLAVWKFMLRKSILDHHRDKLFDLRDRLRATFIANQWDLGSPMYKKLRDLINGYLRFTENFSLSQYSFLKSSLRKNKSLHETLKQQFEKEFRANSADEAVFIVDFRHEALQVMMSYMILSSGPMLILTLLITPAVIASALCRIIGRGMTASVGIIFGKFVMFQLSFILVIKVAAIKIADKVLIDDFVEELSYREGRQVAHAA